MNKIKTIQKVLLDILIILLLIDICTFNYFNNKKPVSIFKHYFFTVLTGSMEPTIKTGSHIIVKECDDYKVGDIVTYKKNNIYVSHRIVRLDGESVITKGDANKTDDNPINKKDIIGKYVFKSKILDFIIKYKVFILIGLFIIYLIIQLIKTIKS